MITAVLLPMLVLLALLLAAFIYQIATTPLTAVDAPTLARSAAAPAAPAPPSHTAARPHRHAAGPPGLPAEASGRPSSWTAAALAIAGLAAVIIGGWLFLHLPAGAAACSHQAIEVCSQGFVLFTGTQLAGTAIAVAGFSAIVITIVRAMR